MSRTNRVVFYFHHPAAALGLDVGIGSREAQQLVAQVHMGDTLTIYYDASGTLIHQRVNSLSYQVELAGNRMLYPLAEMRRRYRLQAALYGLLTLLFMLHGRKLYAVSR